ncbi:MAG: ribonuclease III [Deltaproteobacteria bacterium]|nr:ribonuclease III [Deltaproteobacteria bacterium]MCW5807464.1 ribonuclease III [Deltaproteobacteria bacterium]
MADPSPPDAPRAFRELEDVLGYRFGDGELLEQALRHASYCNEQGKKQQDNQRLEFLGDAVLSLCVSQRLMSRFPTAHEGDLSVTRAQVVSEEGLSEVARTLGFGNYLLLGKGEEKSGGRGKAKILADAFEAIIAAVYLDGGFQAANDLVERLLTERINAAEIKNFYDFKTRLQETSQARLRATPTYRVVQELGPDHDKRFVVAVTIGNDEWARAVGKSKKEAEQMAAAEAHFRLQGSDAGIRPKR